jgi:hypothetical protein
LKLYFYSGFDLFGRKKLGSIQRKTSFKSLLCNKTELEEDSTRNWVHSIPEFITHSLVFWDFEVLRLFKKKLKRWRWVGEED